MVELDVARLCDFGREGLSEAIDILRNAANANRDAVLNVCRRQVRTVRVAGHLVARRDGQLGLIFEPAGDAPVMKLKALGRRMDGSVAIAGRVQARRRVARHQSDFLTRHDRARRDDAERPQVQVVVLRSADARAQPAPIGEAQRREVTGGAGHVVAAKAIRVQTRRFLHPRRRLASEDRVEKEQFAQGNARGIERIVGWIRDSGQRTEFEVRDDLLIRLLRCRRSHGLVVSTSCPDENDQGNERPNTRGRLHGGTSSCLFRSYTPPHAMSCITPLYRRRAKHINELNSSED